MAANPNPARIPDAEKSCTKCRVVKPYGQFYRDPRTKTGLKSECKARANANGARNTAEYRKRHPERNRQYQQATHLKRRYGLSTQEYQRMVTEAGGRCAVCRELAELVIDHCHDTGQVRKLLEAVR